MNPIQEREEGEEQVEEQEAGEGEDHLHNFRQQWKQELQQGAAGATDQNLEKEKDDAKQEEDLEDGEDAHQPLDVGEPALLLLHHLAATTRPLEIHVRRHFWFVS